MGNKGFERAMGSQADQQASNEGMWGKEPLLGTEEERDAAVKRLRDKGYSVANDMINIEVQKEKNKKGS